SPFSGANAPSEIDDGFASSPANIDRDHGVGYEARSIRSIALRSRSSRRRKSTRFAVVLNGPSSADDPGKEPRGKAALVERAEGERRSCPGSISVGDP